MLLQTLEVTIPAGTNESDAVDLEDAVELALQMPAAWTAAAIYFLASDRMDGTYQPVSDKAGIELTVAAAASKTLSLGTYKNELAPFRYVKICSGTSGAKVNQVAARTIRIMRKG
jgi:hypothetical protein